MAKAKYKIDTLLETNDGFVGKVTAIVTKKDGYTYELGGGERDVTESEVAQGYRPITARVTKPRAQKATKSSKSSKSNGVAHAQAQQ